MSVPCGQEDTITIIKNDVETVKVDVKEAFGEIKESVNLFHSSQTRMTEILVDIAKGGERQAAQAMRISENRESIAELRKDVNTAHVKLRNVELALNTSSASTPSGDSKFDKVQITIITALCLTVLHAMWDIISGLVAQVQLMISSGAP